MEIYMEDYMEVLDYDNSEPEDAWWNEHSEEYEWVPEEELAEQEADMQISEFLDDLREVLNSSNNYGTMGDYYNQVIGCYVFPDYDVYEYFIDIDAVGHEWVQASDGHYLPLLYLDAYEGFRTGDGEEEEEEAPAAVLPSEMEIQTLETLESVRGLLSVIKENNTAFYGGVQQYQTELQQAEERALAYSEYSLYVNIANCVLLAVIAGSKLAHVFWNRMRAG